LNLKKECVIIFDFDGVLINSAPEFLEVYRKVCEKNNKKFPVKTLDEFREWYNSEWEQNYYDLGFTKEDMPGILELEKAILDYDKVKFFDGIKEILLELYRDYKLAVASTTPSEKIKEKLRREKIDHIFSIISGGDDGKSDKKKKIQKVLDYLTVSPEKCIMVGDTVIDIKSAKAVGVKCIALTCGWNTKRKLEEASPYLIFDNHKDMVHAIHYILPVSKESGR